MEDVSKSAVEKWRAEVGAPAPDAPDEVWDAWINEDTIGEAPPGPPLVILDPELSAEDEEEQVEIEGARALVLEGAANEVDGRVKIVQGLLRLKKDEKWKKDPLVAHIENPHWKKHYLPELILWLKESNPNLQAGLSTLMNYMKYHQVWCDGFGFSLEEVFGASENTRRALTRMCKWGYGGGLPTDLRNGYDLKKLPVPESMKNATTEEQLVEGMRQVARLAFEQERYAPSLFEEYEAGDGEEKIAVSFQMQLDKNGVLCEWTAFVKRVDCEGNVTASYPADILHSEMPGEVLDKLEAMGVTVEMPF